MPNRLTHASSPYLLQHKDNPVDWYEWGDEAFKLAKEKNKPIFLSIGYATCHWCHVMAHESFEDESIAKLLNNAFINIKVDREERPDIDSTYMTVCQMVTGHGGWPLTIVMTPGKKPFFAGTYIPKEARFGRLGLRQLIPGIQGMWQHEPERIQKAVNQIASGFLKSQHFEPGVFPGTEAIDYAAEQLLDEFDGDWGGFGQSPKFPSPHNLMFLLRQYHHTKQERFLDAVVFTLLQMRLGGIWDHVGFGFHRYSTDRKWLLPHFEKMLYDQALLMMAYTEAWQVTQKPLFKQTVYEIAEYVFRDLTHPEGGFYSAEDADSEGEEGKFYVWEKAELDKSLKEKAHFVHQLFGVKDEGNFEDEATKQFTGKNILHLEAPLSEEEAGHWKPIREVLLEERSKRIRPLLDDKILTDWNGLMIAAFAKAGAAFNEPQFVGAAEKAFAFIKEHLLGEHLLHRFKDGNSGIEAFADDYAFMTWSGIELYETTFKSTYLKASIDFTKKSLEEFWDRELGGFYLTTNDSDQPLGLQKQIYDGAIPSANSTMLTNLIRLSRFTGETSFEVKANKLGELFSNELIRTGSSITMGMMALQFLYHSPKEIVISESEEDPSEIKQFFHSKFLPSKVLIFRPKDGGEISDLAGFIAAQTPINDRTTVYVCENYACDLPFTSLEDIKKAVLS